MVHASYPAKEAMSPKPAFAIGAELFGFRDISAVAVDRQPKRTSSHAVCWVLGAGYNWTADPSGKLPSMDTVQPPFFLAA